jgi:hypothetical protein
MRLSIPTIVIGISAAFASLPAAAVGNYSESFTTTPANWATSGASFSVNSSGQYVTNPPPPQPFRALSIYNGNTWATNYTYTAALYSDFESNGDGTGNDDGGNRVGIVFNYVDASNYYDLSVAMRKTQTTDPTSGKALLVKYVNGVRTAVFNFHPTKDEDVAAWPTRDTFFPVTVTRVGVNLAIKVNGIVVYDGNDLTGTNAGRIGVFAQSNNGRFDDVSVVDQTPTYTFRSGFNSPIQITDITCLANSGSTTDGQWFARLTGQDAGGGSWPLTNSFWGAAATNTFNTGAPCTPGSTDTTQLDKFVEIRTPNNQPGPTGVISQYLTNEVKAWHHQNDPNLPYASPRAGAQVELRNGASLPVNQYYIRRYLKYPRDLVSSTATPPTPKMGTSSWFVQHEYKSILCDFAAGGGRLTVTWERISGVPTYVLKRDKNNNCPGSSDEVIWHRDFVPGTNGVPAMPVDPASAEDQWFYDEFYVSWGTNGAGVVKYAINKKVIIDFATTATDLLPISPNRVKLTPGYLNADNVLIRVDDLEVFNNLPCAAFPCGPPTHVAD